MKSFQEFLEEGAANDPLARKLSGGRGDNPELKGQDDPDTLHQISDKQKPQDHSSTKYLEKIRPKIPVMKQNSSNIHANDGKKNTAEKPPQ